MIVAPDRRAPHHQENHMPDTPDSPTLSRRAVVVAGGAVALGAGVVVAGCSSPTSAAPAASGTALGPTSEVPVGGGKIFADQGVVVTQPTAGTYAGFSVVCPHQGCSVNSVTTTGIVCPCHGSVFALDGSVVKGPAQTGLKATGVAVTGSEITLS
jgi:Rieske Fe-S protein